MSKIIKNVRGGASNLSHNFGYVIFGMIIALFAAIPTAPSLTDLMSNEAPPAIPIEAQVELVPWVNGTWRVSYWPYAEEPTSAVWSVHGVARGGARLFTQRGDGQYDDQVTEPSVWTWTAFHEGYDPLPPAIPTEPFRLCLYYHSEVPGERRIDRFGPFCTSYSDELEIDQ